MYYKCGNTHLSGHPKARWREEDLEAAIIKELDSIRIPSPDIASWFRDCLEEAFSDITATRGQQQKVLAKRKSELANMQDRLLNGYLLGTIDETIYNMKSVELKRDAEGVDRQLDEAGNFDSSQKELALTVFDFSRKLVEIWQGSSFAARRDIFECVSSNRTIDSLSRQSRKEIPQITQITQKTICEICGKRVRVHSWFSAFPLRASASSAVSARQLLREKRSCLAQRI